MRAILKTYELCLGNDSLDAVIDRIADDAHAVAPGLPRVRARALAAAMFHARVVQTLACGRFPECQPQRSLWGEQAPRTGALRPCGFRDFDPYDLPNVFAAACADELDLSGDYRDATEERLAGAFRSAIAPLLFENERCGHAGICDAVPTDPFRR
jgi:hypothetical protein